MEAVETGLTSWDLTAWIGFRQQQLGCGFGQDYPLLYGPQEISWMRHTFPVSVTGYNKQLQTRQGLQTLMKDSFLSGTTVPRALGAEGGTSGGPRLQLPGRKVPAPPKSSKAALTTTASTGPAFRGKLRPAAMAAFFRHGRHVSLEGPPRLQYDARERSGILQRHGQPGRGQDRTVRAPAAPRSGTQVTPEAKTSNQNLSPAVRSPGSSAPSTGSRQGHPTQGRLVPPAHGFL